MQPVGKMTIPNLIELEHINVVWDNFKVLDDVNLIIEPRDFITVVGPNGAGTVSYTHLTLPTKA